LKDAREEGIDQRVVLGRRLVVDVVRCAGDDVVLGAGRQLVQPVGNLAVDHHPAFGREIAGKQDVPIAGGERWRQPPDRPQAREIPR